MTTSHEALSAWRSWLTAADLSPQTIRLRTYQLAVAGAILSTVGAFALREDHSSGGGQSSSGSGAGSGASGDL